MIYDIHALLDPCMACIDAINRMAEGLKAWDSRLHVRTFLLRPRKSQKGAHRPPTPASPPG
jgi:hypothetical protein